MELLWCQSVKFQLLILVAVVCGIFKCVPSSVVPQSYPLAIVALVVEGSEGASMASHSGHIVVAPQALELLPVGEHVVHVGVVQVEHGVVGCCVNLPHVAPHPDMQVIMRQA